MLGSRPLTVTVAEPSGFGFEKEVAKRLEWWAGIRKKMGDGSR